MKALILLAFILPQPPAKVVRDTTRTKFDDMPIAVWYVAQKTTVLKPISKPAETPKIKKP